MPTSFEWQAAVWLQVELDGEGPSRLPRLGMRKVNGTAGSDTVIAGGLHVFLTCRGLDTWGATAWSCLVQIYFTCLQDGKGMEGAAGRQFPNFVPYGRTNGWAADERTLQGMSPVQKSEVKRTKQGCCTACTIM